MSSWTEIARRGRSIGHSVETRTWWEVARRWSIAATILLRRIVAAKLRLRRIAGRREWRLTTVLRLLTLSRRALTRTRRVLQSMIVSLAAPNKDI